MDLRYAVRTLSGTPGFTALAVATLALGIGINTVVFTIYGSVAFRQLPVRAPDEIVRLRWHLNGVASEEFSWSEYQRLVSSTHSFAAVIATSAPKTIVCNLFGFSPVRVGAARARLVSPNYFETLGISAELGRAFGSSDHASVVLSHEFWRSKLHADSGVIGKSLSVEGGTLSVIGVVPEQFAGTGMPPQTPDLWIPASAQSLLLPRTASISNNSAREWQVLARRRSVVEARQYLAELAVLSSAWPLEAGRPIQLSAITATFFQLDGGAFRGFMAVCMILLVAVALVLLIGCVNLTNLIAARNSGRTLEVAVRLALGASRWQLVRQFCTESLVLGLLGGIAGLFFSVWTCAWLGKKALDVIQEITNGAAGVSLDLSPDWHVFVWTAALSIAVGVAVGVFPALRASSGNISSTLKEGMAGALWAVGIRHNRNLLLTAQVASCLVLLAAAGLLFRGASRSAGVSVGFDFKHLTVVGIDTQTAGTSAPAQVELQQQIVERMRSLPTVTSVAWADRAPFLGSGTGLFRNEQGSAIGCAFNGVSDEYFGALGIPMLRGRTFTAREIEQESPIAVISESTARRLWPGQDALGRRISPATGWLRDVAGQTSFTVVGVVKTVRSTYLSKQDEGYVYIPRRLHDSHALLLVRTSGTPDKSFRSMSEEIARLSPSLPAQSYMVSLESGPMRVQELMAQAPAVAASVLGGLALLLACLGLYGVVSHLVSQRRREIGIRRALGAAAWDVIGVVSRQTLWPVAWGGGVGLLGAFGASALLRALIAMPDVPDLTYGAGAFDPVTFLCVVTVLGVVIAIAFYLPLRRAIKLEPATALRNE